MRIVEKAFIYASFVASVCFLLSIHLDASEGFQFGSTPVGYVFVSRPPSYEDEQFKIDSNFTSCRRAVGHVAVPDGQFIGIELVGSRIVDHESIGQLPRQLRSLVVADAVLTRKHVSRLINQLPNLEIIQFRNCGFAADAFDESLSLTKLKSFGLNSRTIKEVESSLTQWLVKQSSLERLACSPQLPAASLNQLVGLTRLTECNVELGADASSIIEALKQIRSLRSLNVIVREECPENALDQLGQLSDLVRFRQYSGEVSHEALAGFAKAGRLKYLDLAHVTIQAEDVQAISGIGSLQSLTISTREESEKELSNLWQTCVMLKELRKWPKLTGLSEQDFEEIMSHPCIEQLSIGPSKLLSPKSLQRIAQLTKLRELNVEGVSVNDDWLERMASLKELERIDLFNTKVTGRGFAVFRDHQCLRRVDLFFGNSEAELIEPHLEALSAIKLQELNLSGTFSMRALAPIANMQSLVALSLSGPCGMSDDRLIPLLRNLPELRRLSLEDNCFITDGGACELSSLVQLQYVTVNGFISDIGAKALSTIPSLRQLVISSSDIEHMASQNDLPRTIVRDFMGNVDSLGIKNTREPASVSDGFVRRGKFKGVEYVRGLEGSSPPKLQVEQFVNSADFKWEDYRGKVVLLEFWGTWCGPCRAQIPKLKRLYDKHKSQGLEIVAVHTTSGAEQMSDFAAKNNLPWIKLVDQDELTAKRYFVPHFPATYLIDRSGSLRVALVHPEGLEDAIEKLLSEK